MSNSKSAPKNAKINKSNKKLKTKEPSYKTLYNKLPTYNVAKPLTPAIYNPPPYLMNMFMGIMNGDDVEFEYDGEMWRSAELECAGHNIEGKPEIWGFKNNAENEDDERELIFDCYRGLIEIGEGAGASYGGAHILERAKPHSRLPKSAPFTKFMADNMFMLAETALINELGEWYADDKNMNDSERSSYRGLFTRKKLTPAEKEAKKKQREEAKKAKQANMTAEEIEAEEKAKADALHASKVKNYWKKAMNDRATIECKCGGMVKVMDGNKKWEAHFTTPKHLGKCPNMTTAEMEKINKMKEKKIAEQVALKEKIEKYLETHNRIETIAKFHLREDFFDLPAERKVKTKAEKAQLLIAQLTAMGVEIPEGMNLPDGTTFQIAE